MEHEFLKAIASVALPTLMSDYFTVVGVEQTEIHISQAYNNFPQKKQPFRFFWLKGILISSYLYNLVEKHTCIIIFLYNFVLSTVQNI